MGKTEGVGVRGLRQRQRQGLVGAEAARRRATNNHKNSRSNACQRAKLTRAPSVSFLSRSQPSAVPGWGFRISFCARPAEAQTFEEKDKMKERPRGGTTMSPRRLVATSIGVALVQLSLLLPVLLLGAEAEASTAELCPPLAEGECVNWNEKADPEASENRFGSLEWCNRGHVRFSTSSESEMRFDVLFSQFANEAASGGSPGDELRYEQEFLCGDTVPEEIEVQGDDERRLSSVACEAIGGRATVTFVCCEEAEGVEQDAGRSAGTRSNPMGLALRSVKIVGAETSTPKGLDVQMCARCMCGFKDSGGSRELEVSADGSVAATDAASSPASSSSSSPRASPGAATARSIWSSLVDLLPSLTEIATPLMQGPTRVSIERQFKKRREAGEKEGAQQRRDPSVSSSSSSSSSLSKAATSRRADEQQMKKKKKEEEEKRKRKRKRRDDDDDDDDVEVEVEGDEGDHLKRPFVLLNSDPELVASRPPPPHPALRLRKGERRKLRERTRGLFLHAYDNYIDHAWPADELKPLSCRGGRQGQTAGKMLTLVDSLDTLAIMGEEERFW